MRPPRRARVVVEISDVMRRLVAVRVLPDESGDIGLFASRKLGFGRKEFIEFRRKLFLAAVECDQSAYVLRCEKRILPAIAFGEIKGNFLRRERRNEAAVFARAHKARVRVEEIAI